MRGSIIVAALLAQGCLSEPAVTVTSGNHTYCDLTGGDVAICTTVMEVSPRSGEVLETVNKIDVNDCKLLPAQTETHTYAVKGGGLVSPDGVALKVISEDGVATADWDVESTMEVVILDKQPTGCDEIVEVMARVAARDVKRALRDMFKELKDAAKEIRNAE